MNATTTVTGDEHTFDVMRSFICDHGAVQTVPLILRQPLPLPPISLVVDPFEIVCHSSLAQTIPRPLTPKDSVANANESQAGATKAIVTRAETPVAASSPDRKAALVTLTATSNLPTSWQMPAKVERLGAQLQNEATPLEILDVVAYISQSSAVTHRALRQHYCDLAREAMIRDGERMVQGRGREGMIYGREL